MCGRFTQSERVDRIAEIFGAGVDPTLPSPSYNVAPTDPIKIVLTRDGRRRLTAAGWGFQPHWRARAPRRQPGWINAKAETAAYSPVFGAALRGRRCVIPADAFYEWDRSHRPPQPYAIGPADPSGILAFAGIWTVVDDGIGAAILTTAPNREMAGLHHRMPVILARDSLDAWLAPDLRLEEMVPMLAPAPDGSLRIWPVSTAVNSVRNNAPELLAPV